MTGRIISVLLVAIALGCDNDHGRNSKCETGSADMRYEKCADEITDGVVMWLKKWTKDAWKNPSWTNQEYYQGGGFRNRCKSTTLLELDKISQDHARCRPLVARFFAQLMSEQRQEFYHKHYLSNRLLKLDYIYALDIVLIAHEGRIEEWTKDILYFVTHQGENVKVVAVKAGDLGTYNTYILTGAVAFSNNRYSCNGICLCTSHDLNIVDDCFRGSDDRGLTDFFKDLVKGNASLYWGIGGKWRSQVSDGKWFHVIPCGKYVFSKKNFEEWVEKNYGESVLQLTLVKTSDNEYIFSTIDERSFGGKREGQCKP